MRTYRVDLAIVRAELRHSIRWGVERSRLPRQLVLDGAALLLPAFRDER